MKILMKICLSFFIVMNFSFGKNLISNESFSESIIGKPIYEVLPDFTKEMFNKENFMQKKSRATYVIEERTFFDIRYRKENDLSLKTLEMNGFYTIEFFGEYLDRSTDNEITERYFCIYLDSYLKIRKIDVTVSLDNQSTQIRLSKQLEVLQENLEGMDLIINYLVSK